MRNRTKNFAGNIYQRIRRNIRQNSIAQSIHEFVTNRHTRHTFVNGIGVFAAGATIYGVLDTTIVNLLRDIRDNVVEGNRHLRGLRQDNERLAREQEERLVKQQANNNQNILNNLGIVDTMLRVVLTIRNLLIRNSPNNNNTNQNSGQSTGHRTENDSPFKTPPSGRAHKARKKEEYVQKRNEE